LFKIPFQRRRWKNGPNNTNASSNMRNERLKRRTANFEESGVLGEERRKKNTLQRERRWRNARELAHENRQTRPVVLGKKMVRLV
jgi:hypothetical protein